MKKLKGKGEKCSLSLGEHLGWGIVLLALKVLGLALIVQGFIVQLGSGFLFQGMLHYALGIIVLVVAWWVKGRSCCACQCCW